MRNRKVAHILATDWFLKLKQQQNETGYFSGSCRPGKTAIITLIALQTMTSNAAEHFDTTRQAVSKQLRILTECELIKQEHKGREIYYQPEINKMKEMDKWLEQLRKN